MTMTVLIVESCKARPVPAMRKHRVTSIGLIGLLTVLAVGCSKMTAVEEAEVRQSFGLPADMPLKNLGMVELHPGIPKRASARRGEDCTVTATVLTNGAVRLNLHYESRGEVVDGVKIQPYSEQSQVILPPGLLEKAMKSKSWLCFPPMRPRFAVAMRPIIVQ